MLGAIIGDIIGSRHEFSPIWTRDFELFGAGCTFTDDTVLTMAVMDGIAAQRNPAETLKQYAWQYPGRGYGQRFQLWVSTAGKMAYDSYGNGSVMRISPVAMYAGNLQEAEALADTWTGVTHNHPVAMRSAKAYCRILVRLRDERPEPAAAHALILQELAVIGLKPQTVEEYHQLRGFHIQADETLMRAAAAILEASSFEEAMRHVAYIGSDVDTTMAVAGAMAELIHGIPDDIATGVLDIFGHRHANLAQDLLHHYAHSRLGNQHWRDAFVGHEFINQQAEGGNALYGRTRRCGASFGRIAYASQSRLRLAQPQTNVAVISIRDSGNEHLDLEGWGMALTVNFLDVEELSWPRKMLAGLPLPAAFMEPLASQVSRMDRWAWRPMFPCDADQIARFIHAAQAAGMDELLVCCEYGRSRSTAVAEAAYAASPAGHTVFEPPAKRNMRVRGMVGRRLG